MNLDIGAISYKELKIEQHYGSIEFIKMLIDNKGNVDDETLSWLINSPPIYASRKTDAMEKIMKDHALSYEKNKAKSITIVRAVKKEFYDFLCTESKNYKKERNLLNGNINLLIAGIASAVATRLGNIEIGIVTSFITMLIMILAKIGKRAMCSAYKVS